MKYSMLPLTSNPFKFTPAISLIRYQKGKIKKTERLYYEWLYNLRYNSIWNTVLRDFILGKHFYLIWVAQANIFSSSSFLSVRRKNFPVRITSVSNSTFFEIFRLRNFWCMPPYNLRHQKYFVWKTCWWML